MGGGGVCFHRSKFSPSYVGPHLGRVLSAGEANTKSQNMSSPSGCGASGWRRADADATSLRCIDVNTTSFDVVYLLASVKRKNG